MPKLAATSSELGGFLAKRYSDVSAHLRDLVGEQNFNSPTSLSETQLAKLQSYLGLLNSWTKKIDLVSEANLELLCERHIIDSLAADVLLRAKLKLAPGESIMDLGSGGGLPGVVLSVMQPEQPVLLVEPREKRCVFLNEVKRRLELTELSVRVSRAEELEVSDFPVLRGMVCRAFGLPELFIQTGKRLMTEGGTLAFLLGPEQELDGIYALIEGENLLVEELLEYSLGADGSSRRLLLVRV